MPTQVKYMTRLALHSNLVLNKLKQVPQIIRKLTGRSYSLSKPQLLSENEIEPLKAFLQKNYLMAEQRKLKKAKTSNSSKLVLPNGALKSSKIIILKINTLYRSSDHN